MKGTDLLKTAGITIAVLSLLSACSESPDKITTAPSPTGNSPPPETIQGIATPSSVAVVTATNAE